MKKHNLEIDIDSLEHTPLYPPRRKFWDCLPIFVREGWLKLGWHSPQPTPREEWLIKSAYLRARFATYREIVHAIAVQAKAVENVQNLTGYMTPGSGELN